MENQGKWNRGNKAKLNIHFLSKPILLQGVRKLALSSARTP